MAMSSEIDYIIRAKDYNSILKLKEYIKTMNDLFEQLLLITNIENTEKLPQKFENISIRTKVLVSTLQKKYTDKDLSFELNIKDNITINCHWPSFDMILQNLLDNACKYTKNKWNIKIQLNEHNLIISDDWIWISNHNKEKIRDRFWQEDPAKSDRKSFWLGLYLVKKLIDLQKWTVYIDSEVNEWTEFSVNF